MEPAQLKLDDATAKKVQAAADAIAEMANAGRAAFQAVTRYYSLKNERERAAALKE